MIYTKKQVNTIWKGVELLHENIIDEQIENKNDIHDLILNMNIEKNKIFEEDKELMMYKDLIIKDIVDLFNQGY